jgi:hypothetical protein
VPYDGADPQYADLCHPPAAPGDKDWYSTNPSWHRVSAEDVRFTTKGDTLNAFVLGWPQDAVTIRALGALAGRVTGVRLLGHEGARQWSQEAAGLRISLPERPPSEHAVAFAIGGVVRPAGRPEPAR